MSDARENIGKALESRLTPEQVDLLLNEILAIKKQANGDFVCKKCGQRQYQKVEISDAPAVTKALIELSNQAWGRPDIASGADEEKITFIREVRK